MYLPIKRKHNLWQNKRERQGRQLRTSGYGARKRDCDAVAMQPARELLRPSIEPVVPPYLDEVLAGGWLQECILNFSLVLVVSVTR